MFDTTNDKPFTTQALKFMKILNEYRQMGWNTPQVAFIPTQILLREWVQIYSEIYALNKYPDTWYKIDGKPLIIGDAKRAPSVINDFFTVRASQWPNDEKVEGGFPWIDFGDTQTVYADKTAIQSCQRIVAQNSAASACFGDSYFYGDTNNKGRSYHDGAANITEDSYKYGYNFQEQWDNAIASDANIAMVLEWTSGWQVLMITAVLNRSTDCRVRLHYTEYSRDNRADERRLF